MKCIFLRWIDVSEAVDHKTCQRVVCLMEYDSFLGGKVNAVCHLVNVWVQRLSNLPFNYEKAGALISNLLILFNPCVRIDD